METSSVIMNTPQSQAIVDVLTRYGFICPSGFGDQIDTGKEFFTRVYLPGKIFEVLYDFELKFFSLEELVFDYSPDGKHRKSRNRILLFSINRDSPDDITYIIGARSDIPDSIYTDLLNRLNSIENPTIQI